MANFNRKIVLIWATLSASLLVPLVEADNDFPTLRIMPLGDSITKGSLSTDGAGYRSFLRKMLKDKGFDVDMIGSLSNGDMEDNDHEGHSGEYLRNISEYYLNSIDALPNVVCLHAGTNNMDKELDLEESPSIIEAIIDGVMEKSEGVTLLVAPVIWANNARMNRNTNTFNKKLEAIISDRQDDGKQILSVPMNITKSDLTDMKHPNDQGYEKMANAWYDAILDAQDREWLETPAKVDKDELPGRGLGNGGDYDSAGNPAVSGSCILSLLIILSMYFNGKRHI